MIHFFSHPPLFFQSLSLCALRKMHARKSVFYSAAVWVCACNYHFYIRPSLLRADKNGAGRISNQKSRAPAEKRNKQRIICLGCERVVLIICKSEHWKFPFISIKRLRCVLERFRISIYTLFPHFNLHVFHCSSFSLKYLKKNLKKLLISIYCVSVNDKCL